LIARTARLAIFLHVQIKFLESLSNEARTKTAIG